jgi:hypothetical protein
MYGTGTAPARVQRADRKKLRSWVVGSVFKQVCGDQGWIHCCANCATSSATMGRKAFRSRKSTRGWRCGVNLHPSLRLKSTNCATLAMGPSERSLYWPCCSLTSTRGIITTSTTSTPARYRLPRRCVQGLDGDQVAELCDQRDLLPNLQLLEGPSTSPNPTRHRSRGRSNRSMMPSACSTPSTGMPWANCLLPPMVLQIL